MTLKSVAVEENSGLYASVYPGSFSVSLTILRRPLPPVSYTHLDVYKRQEVDWYIKAEDIVLKKGAAMNPQTPKKDVPPVK